MLSGPDVIRPLDPYHLSGIKLPCVCQVFQERMEFFLVIFIVISLRIVSLFHQLPIILVFPKQPTVFGLPSHTSYSDIFSRPNSTFAQILLNWFASNSF